MLKTLIISFVIAVLSGLGIGSGGLLVVYLSAFTSIPQISAQGINLLFFLFSALSSTLFNIKKSNIFLKTVIFMSSAGILGCLLGTFLTDCFGNELLKKIFGVMLIISGSISIAKFFWKKIKIKR